MALSTFSTRPPDNRIVVLRNAEGIELDHELKAQTFRHGDTSKRRWWVSKTRPTLRDFCCAIDRLRWAKDELYLLP